ncbi:MAG: DUF2252 domain-containing protein [Clostridia bacterium]
MESANRSEIVKQAFEQYDGQVLGLSKEGLISKYSKMLENPYTFFRGSAYLFFQDLLKHPLLTERKELPTWVQGDLHFENFGAFHDSEGEIVFDSNDFDEAYIGSYMLDVARMVVSIVLVGESLGFSKVEIADAVQTYVKQYEKQLRKYQSKERDPVTTQYSKKNTSGPIRKLLKKVEKRRSRATLLARFAEQTEEGLRFKRNDELESVESEVEAAIRANWPSYIRSIPAEERMVEGNYEIKDIVHKRNSGTGSLGLERYYLLIEGADKSADVQDDIVLEMKEARYSVLDAVLPTHEEFHAQFPHAGDQVVKSQRAMQHQTDPFLGVMTLSEKMYYVRERSPYKKKLAAQDITSAEDFVETCKIMAKLTAKIHARADIDLEQGLLHYHSEDAILRDIDADRKAWRKSLVRFAFEYTEQVKEDYQHFQRILQNLGDQSQSQYGIIGDVS